MDRTIKPRATEQTTRLFVAQSSCIRALMLTGAFSFGCVAVGAALAATPPDPNGTGDAISTGAATGQPADQSAVDARAAEIAKAIDAGTVVAGMTQDQVLAARGEPNRKDVIPPDAELWHYAEGEVAFSGGKVSYVDLEKPRPTTPATTHAPAKPPSPPPAPPAASIAQNTDTGRVNTPGDGFLALRSEPSIRRGRRLYKIPHGTVLTLDECRTWPGDGRWCRTRFRGQTGWVFERYLVR